MRVSDTDRDRAIDLLREAYADGRLRVADFDARASEALAADTYADLTRILGDLPIEPARLPSPPEFGPSATAKPVLRPTRGGSSAARRTSPTRQQKRRSLAASMVALIVIVSGAGLIATAPVSDVYADSYANPYGVVAGDVPSAPLQQRGEETGFEVLRHAGGAGVLTIMADPNDFLVVRVTAAGTIRTSGYGTVTLALPADQATVEVDASGVWRYEFAPADPARQPEAG